MAINWNEYKRHAETMQHIEDALGREILYKSVEYNVISRRIYISELLWTIDPYDLAILIAGKLWQAEKIAAQLGTQGILRRINIDWVVFKDYYIKT